MQRRSFLQMAGLGCASVLGAGALAACEVTWPGLDLPSSDYGPLQGADANGLMLPAGFSSRVIATTGQAVPGTTFNWHAAPDGGACFPAAGGGWIYVSNAEAAAGGASMVRFDSSGAIVEARSILSGTASNCAGGATPWGTWLSCEEHGTGRVWECDPTGATAAVARPAMGRFKHEAVAVDPVRRQLYLTEDEGNGALYRFTPASWPSLAAGTLEVLRDIGGSLSWAVVPDPDGSPTSTRTQVANTKAFNGGEGICYANDGVVFTTKGDNRVWLYGIAANSLDVLYDDNAVTPANPAGSGGLLSGVDNVTNRIINGWVHWFVAEDGGNMEIVTVDLAGHYPFMRLTGVSGSEITGPAFSPDGTRLYFSSQRNPGRTYEVTGPFK